MLWAENLELNKIWSYFIYLCLFMLSFGTRSDKALFMDYHNVAWETQW